MKTYILKRDLPWAKAGTEFKTNDQGFGYISIGYTAVGIQPEDLPDWFEEKKPERWRPKDGELFYYMAGFNQPVVASMYWDEVYNTHRRMHERGNCYQTSEQAEEAARRVKNCLEEYQNELAKEV